MLEVTEMVRGEGKSEFCLCARSKFSLIPKLMLDNLKNNKREKRSKEKKRKKLERSKNPRSRHLGVFGVDTKCWKNPIFNLTLKSRNLKGNYLIILKNKYA